jgi:antitoxin component YwqK of YwqJK toxin-antitoxin module
MSNKGSKGSRIAWVALGAALVLVAALVWNVRTSEVEDVEMTLAALDVREDVLFLKASDEQFNGTLIEDYNRAFRKLEIAIVDGRAHGVSQGWFDNGQMEVEEFFVNGISHGVRTRWFPNGSKKSEAPIAEGVISGRFSQWHENGVLAAVVPMLDGKSHGVAEAWYPSGALKSRVLFAEGVASEKEFFEDGVPVAHADQPKVL